LTRPQVGHFEVAIRGDRDLINFYIRYTLLNDTNIFFILQRQEVARIIVVFAHRTRFMEEKCVIIALAG